MAAWLLGVGRRPEGLHLGKRILACAAPRAPLGGWPLDPIGRRMAMGAGLLGFGRAGADRLPDRTARIAGQWPEHRSTERGIRVRARNLGTAATPLLLEAGLLDRLSPELYVGARPLLLDPGWLHFLRRVLGLHARRSRLTFRAGLLHAILLARSELVLPTALRHSAVGLARLAISPATI